MANSSEENEVAVLRSVALQNAQSILVARQRAEQDLTWRTRHWSGRPKSLPIRFR